MATLFVSRKDASVIDFPNEGATQFPLIGFTTRHQFGPSVHAGLVTRAQPSHFHDVDQFQIFRGGNGATYQRHAIPWLMVHFADAFTTYGPFGPGRGASLTFATIRAKKAGHFPMPGSSDKLPYRAVRNVHAGVGRLDPAALSARSQHTELVLGVDDDGMAAWYLVIAPEAELSLPPSRAAGPRAYWVVEGQFTFEDSAYGPDSAGWSDCGAETARIASSSSGASMLVLDFPNPPSSDRLVARE